jgi:methylglutaconyl-CoA hydratase
MFEKIYETLNLSLEENIFYVCLNRPEVHNAFNEKMIKEITQIFKDIEKQNTIRMVVLKGEGKSFSAGADLNWMKKMKDYTQDENMKDSLELSFMFQQINNCSVPVIGLVHGLALGGGVGLVSVCDYVVADESMKFGLTEVLLGLLPAVISPYVFSKIGESNARAYFLSGQKFSAHKAYEMKLVHAIVKNPSELQIEWKNIKQNFLKASPKAARACKKLIFGLKSHWNNIDESLIEQTCKYIADIRISDEAQEGMNALLEKRKPSWII